MNATLQEQPITYIGISVTADAIETELNGQSYITLNVPEGRTRLIVRLGKPGYSLRIVCEQADGAETAIVQALRAAGFTVGVASTSAVCTAARLHNAAEITPSILAHYGSENAENIKFFIEKPVSPPPPIITSFAAVSQVSRDTRCVYTWTKIVRWLSKLC